VLDVHRRYVAAGCDVISTNTWAIIAAAELEAGRLAGRAGVGVTHWMDIARLGEEHGVAYLMQLSILSQLHTAELLERAGFTARVADFGFFPFTPLFRANREQIRRVEQLSDAFHVTFGDEDVMVAYILEVTRGSRRVPGACILCRGRRKVCNDGCCVRNEPAAGGRDPPGSHG